MSKFCCTDFTGLVTKDMDKIGMNRKAWKKASYNSEMRLVSADIKLQCFV